MKKMMGEKMHVIIGWMLLDVREELQIWALAAWPSDPDQKRKIRLF
jgi:hypothetical protein